MGNKTGDYGSIVTLLNDGDGVEEVKDAIGNADAEYLHVGNTFFVHTDRKDKIYIIINKLKEVDVLFSLIHIGSRIGAFVVGQGMTNNELDKARSLINSRYNYD